MYAKKKKQFLDSSSGRRWVLLPPHIDIPDESEAKFSITLRTFIVVEVVLIYYWNPACEEEGAGKKRRRVANEEPKYTAIPRTVVRDFAVYRRGARKLHRR